MSRVLRITAVVSPCMLDYISAIFSWLACRFRSRVELELEVIALRHQVAVLHRQHPGRRRFVTTDRLLWVLLYRLWPRCLEVMVLVKPATVVQCTVRGSACSGVRVRDPGGRRWNARFAI